MTMVAKTAMALSTNHPGGSVGCMALLLFLWWVTTHITTHILLRPTRFVKSRERRHCLVPSVGCEASRAHSPMGIHQWARANGREPPGAAVGCEPLARARARSVIRFTLLKHPWPFGRGILRGTPPAPGRSGMGPISAPGVGPPGPTSHSQ